MNPIIRKSYESYFVALAEPLKDDLARKMDRIRKDLLDLPEDIQDEELIRAYRERIPEVCVVLEEHSINFSALYDGLPEVPAGMEVFSRLNEKTDSDERIFFSLSAAIESCIEHKDFELALAINEQQNPKQRELQLREIIKAQFPFDETTEAVPEEFKRLYHLLGEDQYLVIWETAFPEGEEGPILQNPKILREFADLTDREPLKQLLLAKSGEVGSSWWCSLY